MIRRVLALALGIVSPSRMATISIADLENGGTLDRWEARVWRRHEQAWRDPFVPTPVEAPPIAPMPGEMCCTKCGTYQLPDAATDACWECGGDLAFESDAEAFAGLYASRTPPPK